MGAFLLHELLTPHPWIDLKAFINGPLPFLLVLIALLRLTILSTAYLIPQYLEPCAASVRWKSVIP